MDEPRSDDMSWIEFEKVGWMPPASLIAGVILALAVIVGIVILAI